VVATLETKNVCIAEDFAEEIGLSYGQYVNHRVSKSVTEQYEDLLASEPDVFPQCVDLIARFSTSWSMTVKSRRSIDLSRRDPEIGRSTSQRIQSSRMAT
jgi:hypothetical protein